MKTIGLVGGTGWVSTVEYYRLINEETNKRLGGLEFAKCLLHSFNYADLERLKKSSDKDQMYKFVEQAAINLTKIGAEGIGLCANTLHKYADRLEKNLSVPVIHIATATALELKKHGLDKVGLLGTKPTMEQDFYSSKLKLYGIETLIPESEDRDFINNSIFTELFYLKFHETTRQRFLDIVEKLQTRGAQGIVLGCTEIPLLIKQKHLDIPVYDTLAIHSRSLVDFALDKN